MEYLPWFFFWHFHKILPRFCAVDLTRQWLPWIRQIMRTIHFMSSFTAAWAPRVHLVLMCVAVCPVVSKNWTFEYMNQQKIIKQRIFWLKTTRAAQTSVWPALKCAILPWKTGMRNHALADACIRISHRKSMLVRNGSGTLKSQRELLKSLSLRLRSLITWTDFRGKVKVEILR